MARRPTTTADAQLTALRQHVEQDPDAAWQQAAESPIVKPKKALVSKPVPVAEPGPPLPVEAQTGIPLVDWVYANLDQAQPLTPPKAAGDLALLAYYREHPEEFYPRVFMPALLKRYEPQPPAPGSLPADEPEDDPAVALADRLLREYAAEDGKEHRHAWER